MKVLSTQNILYNSVSFKAPKTAPNIRQIEDDTTSRVKISAPSFKALLFQNKLNIAEKKEIENIIDNYQSNNEKITLLGKGTFGTVYKIRLKEKGDVAVKILSPENEKLLYGGGNLKKEAEILQNIPSFCKNTQQLVEYFETPKRVYLVSSIVKGVPLSKRTVISQKLMDSITDELFKYDTNGLMFYDLNDNNILVDREKAGFIDFEFMEYKNPKLNNTASYNDPHHVGRNFFHPQKSNINAFENRSLGKFIIRTEKTQGFLESEKLVEIYLKSLAKYHRKTAIFLKRNKNTQPDNISYTAIKYEEILSKLYEKPSKEIIKLEKDFIKLRYTTLNYHLYVHRKNQNKLIEGDIETYGDFNKYITNMKKLTESILEQLKILENSNKNNKDIIQYTKVNRIYIENFLRKNANPHYIKARSNEDLNSLESLAKLIISDYNNLKKAEKLDTRIIDFLSQYKSLRKSCKDNPDALNYCDSIKILFEKTLEFIKKEQI